MSDLTKRLRGQYKLCPDGEYGARDFSKFIPAISIEAADRIDELEKHANVWIAVDTALPEDGDYSVFVCFSNGSVEDMRMVHVQDWIRDKCFLENCVTHWMPLPKPPGE